RTNIFDELIQRGLYRARPDRVKSGWLAAAAILTIAIAAIGNTVGVARFNLSPVAVVLAAGLTGIIVALVALVMPARTGAGSRALERVLAFEEFLRRVEGDRYKDLVKTPEMFERFLPYALVFQVERKWAGAFEIIYREPPRWYVGSGGMPFNSYPLPSRLS